MMCPGGEKSLNSREEEDTSNDKKNEE